MTLGATDPSEPSTPEAPAEPDAPSSTEESAAPAAPEAASPAEEPAAAETPAPPDAAPPAGTTSEHEPEPVAAAAPASPTPLEVAQAAARAAAEAAAAAQAAAARLADPSAPTPGSPAAAALAAEAAAAATAAADAARVAMAAAESLTLPAGGAAGADRPPAATVPSWSGLDAAVPTQPPPPAEPAPAGPVTHVIPVPPDPSARRRWTPLRRLLGAVAALVIGVATAFVIIGMSVLLLLNPIWISAEQTRAEAGRATQFGPDDLRFVTSSILFDLVVGPPDFDVALNGTPVLNDRERAHLRDVRTTFIAFAAIALVSLVVLIAARIVTRGSRPYYVRVRRGARAIAVLTLLVGAVGLLAFGPAFELFHQVLFPAGNYTFDPARDRLVQLFPERFWVESTLVLGGAVLVFAFAFGRWADGRLRGPKRSRSAPRGAVVASRSAG